MRDIFLDIRVILLAALVGVMAFAAMPMIVFADNHTADDQYSLPAEFGQFDAETPPHEEEETTSGSGGGGGGGGGGGPSPEQMIQDFMGKIAGMPAGQNVADAANSMCNPVKFECGCGQIMGSNGCTGGPNMWQCPCGAPISGVQGGVVMGICMGPNKCEGLQYAGGGQPGGGVDSGLQALSGILESLMGLMQGGGGGGGTGAGGEYVPPTYTSPSSDFFSPSQPNTNFGDGMFDDLMDPGFTFDGSGLTQPGFTWDTGTTQTQPGFNWSDIIGTSTQQPGFNWGSAGDTGNTTQEPGFNWGFGDNTTATNSNTIGGFNTEDDPGLVFDEVNSGPGTGGTGSTAGGSGGAGGTEEGVGETSGFTNAVTNVTNSVTGALLRPMAGLLEGPCASRPWSESMLSRVIPDTFFDGICEMLGLEIGTSIIEPQTPGTIGGGSQQPEQPTGGVIDETVARGMECDPSTIRAGESAELAFSCAPAQLAGTAGFRVEDAEFTRVSVSPTRTTQYGILCSDDFTASCTLRVVNPQARIWTIPSEPRLGTRATVYWDSQDVESCTVEGPSFFETSLSGGASTVPFTRAETFTITCLASGDGAEVSDSITVGLGL